MCTCRIGTPRCASYSHPTSLKKGVALPRSSKSFQKICCFFHFAVAKTALSVFLIWAKKSKCPLPKHPTATVVVEKRLSLKLAEFSLAVLRVSEGSQHSTSRQFLRARFYHGAKIREYAHFVTWESCWGCHPKPAFLRPQPLEKSIKKFLVFFKKHFRFASCFSPIGERAKHDKKKEVYDYEKIQHAAPQPGDQNTPD